MYLANRLLRYRPLYRVLLYRRLPTFTLLLDTFTGMTPLIAEVITYPDRKALLTGRKQSRRRLFSLGVFLA